MSWFEGRATKITYGSEFNDGKSLNGNPKVEYHLCEYCRKEILVVDDDLRDGWGFYYGNQAVKPNVYQYSPVIVAMKKHNGVIDDKDERVKEILDKIYSLQRVTKEERMFLIEHIYPFNQAQGNFLANLHSRCHPVGKEHQYDWDLRAGKNTIKLLCNACFDKTKNRYRVHLDDGREVAISVVEVRKETPEKVLEELGLKGQVLEKNAYVGW